MTLTYSREEILNIVEEPFLSDYERIFNFTTSSIKTTANSQYKKALFLDATDIEQIKRALNEYKNHNESVSEFKEALISDLTSFQDEIKTNYQKRIDELTKERQACEKQIKIAEFSKNKLIMDRLSKVEWPYDAKTKEYENTVAKLKLKVKNIEQRIEEAKTMRPLANEKDILKYQMHLKEAFLTD